MAVPSDPGLHFQVREILGLGDPSNPGLFCPSLCGCVHHTAASRQPCKEQYLHIGFLLLKPHLPWDVGNQIVID